MSTLAPAPEFRGDTGLAAGSVMAPLSKSRTLRQTHEGEHSNDFGESPVPLTFATMAFAVCAAANSVELGYEMGTAVRLGELVQIDLDLTQDQRRLFIHSLPFLSIFGCMWSWYVADKFGRRSAFFLSGIFAVVGTLVSASANSFNHLMFGRIIASGGMGLGLFADPLYIAEMSPAKHRGWMISWTELGRISGAIVGFNVSIALNGIGTSLHWRLMLLTSICIPLTSIFLTWKILPESPRWLMSRKRTDEARAILRDVYGPTFDTEPLVESIEDSLQREAQTIGGAGFSTFLCSTPAYRRIALVGVVVGACNQALGYNALHYYVVEIIYEAGLKNTNFEDLVLVAIYSGNLLYTFIAGRMMDNRGRRPLLIFSSAGCGIVMIFYSFLFMGNHEPSLKAKVLLVVAYFTLYSFGLGAGTIVVMSEIFPTSVRAKGMAMATCLNLLCGTMVNAFYPPLARFLGWESVFAVYGMCCFLMTFIFYMWLPETKGRSMEMMAVYFGEVTGDTTVLDAETELVRRREQSVNISASAVVHEDSAGII